MKLLTLLLYQISRVDVVQLKNVLRSRKFEIWKCRVSLHLFCAVLWDTVNAPSVIWITVGFFSRFLSQSHW